MPKPMRMVGSVAGGKLCANGGGCLAGHGQRGQGWHPTMDSPACLLDRPERGDARVHAKAATSYFLLIAAL
jgi:hypothetical protein